MGEGTNFRPGGYFSEAREDARSGLRCAHGMARPTGFFARDSIRNAPISPLYLRLYSARLACRAGTMPSIGWSR